MFFDCEKCGSRVSDNMKFCWKCGSPATRISSPTAPIITSTIDQIRLDCSACKTTASMTATKVGKFGDIVRVIGGILLVPSFLGMALAALTFVSTIMGTASMPSARSDAEEAGRAIGFGMVFIFTVVVGVGSLVGGLLGWLLLSNRKVYKCQNCGFIIDRA